jgi:hypothetical protein
MKWYWAKIIVGALVIFGVGYAGISVARAAKRQVHEVAESDSDISIPLKFIPFKFEGMKSGTFRKLVIHRSSPHAVEGVDITVRVSDPGLVEKLAGCSVTVDNPTQITGNTTFRCADAGATDLEPFGEVIVEPGPGAADIEPRSFTLVIPKKVIADLQGHGAQAATEDAERLQSIRLRELTDSLRLLSEAVGKAATEEARDEIRSQIDEVQSAIEDVQEAISETAEARAHDARAAARAAARSRTHQP